MSTTAPWTHRIATSKARTHLSEIVTRVQDPRSYCVLTRHGKALAAIVPMSGLQRIHDLEDIEDIASGKSYPMKFHFGKGNQFPPLISNRHGAMLPIFFRVILNLF
jgi:antitoxin (DNA-binding transcriptional repressor) of toxin-antitoxin stability system